MVVIVIAVAILLFPTPGIAGEGTNHSEMEGIQILKIAPLEGRAVIKFRDGSLRMIKPGDAIYEGARVSDIAEGRIVVEETTEKGMETLIIRVKEGKQKIERFRKIVEPEPIPAMPK